MSAPERPGKATSLDVARRAGVSRATVSRCFSPTSPVSPATRERVLRIARDLGYEPNLLARMLNTRQSSIVAVLTSEFANPFQPALMEALTESLRAEGLTPLLLKARSAAEPADALIQLALSYRVAAIVVTVLNGSEEIIARCAAEGVPVIFLNRRAETEDAVSISSNSAAGAARIAEILVEGGTTRIGMITGNSGTWVNSMRRGPFVARLDALGHDVRGARKGEFTYGGGAAAALELLEADPRIDAIYACNDAMALGAMDALRQVRGARVPEDVAVIGFDGVPMSAWGAYRLSTIRQPVLDLVEETRAILARPDRGLGLAGQIVLKDGAFIQRATTRPVTLRAAELSEDAWLPKAGEATF